MKVNDPTRYVFFLALAGVCSVGLSGLCVEIQSAGWMRDMFLLIATLALGSAMVFALFGN